MAAGTGRGHSVILYPKAYSETRVTNETKNKQPLECPVAGKGTLSPLGLAPPGLASLSAFFHLVPSLKEGKRLKLLT